MSVPLRSLRRALTCRSAALRAPDRFTSARHGRACEDGSAHTCLLIAVSVLTFVFKYRLALEQFETFSLLVPADDSLTFRLSQPACRSTFCPKAAVFSILPLYGEQTTTLLLQKLYRRHPRYSHAGRLYGLFFVNRPIPSYI